MTSIGVRVSDDLLEKLDRLSEEENVDRSTVIRKLLERGYEDFMREVAAERYRTGDITISEAAALAEVTLWEMEQYLVREGYTSAYSIADLERDIDRLRSTRES